MAVTTFKIGDITIHRVVEQEGPFFNPLEFFPSLTPELLEENRGWMTDGGYLDRQSGQLVLCIQSYLVQTRHHNILIDSCVGNHKPRPTRPFWNMLNTDRFEKGLAGTGVSVDQIDYVMCTHLHVDHVGWNTRLENGRWVPTFPKARYVFADRERQELHEQGTHSPAIFRTERFSAAERKDLDHIGRDRASPVEEDGGNLVAQVLGLPAVVFDEALCNGVHSGSGDIPCSPNHRADARRRVVHLCASACQ